MDFTKILSAFAAIENTKTLTESEKKETTWTDMKGNKHPATQVKGDKYTGKEAEKEDKKKKEVADVKNTAEMIMYTAEKALKDNDAKISAGVKDGVNAKITALRGVKDGTDAEAAVEGSAGRSALAHGFSAARVGSAAGKVLKSQVVSH